MSNFYFHKKRKSTFFLNLFREKMSTLQKHTVIMCGGWLIFFLFFVVLANARKTRSMVIYEHWAGWEWYHMQPLWTIFDQFLNDFRWEAEAIDYCSKFFYWKINKQRDRFAGADCTVFAITFKCRAVRCVSLLPPVANVQFLCAFFVVWVRAYKRQQSPKNNRDTLKRKI